MTAQFLWQRLYVSFSLPFPTSLQRASSWLIGQESIQLPGGGIGYWALFVVHKLNRPTAKCDGEILFFWEDDLPLQRVYQGTGQFVLPSLFLQM
jgi:hypothetical protein